MGTVNFDQQIKRVIEAFVDELSELVRKAAVQSVTEAFGAAGGTATRAGRGRVPTARGGRPKGQKRAPEDLVRTTNLLLSEIKTQPGLRMEQIAQALKSTTKDLALPARKLLAEKRIRTKGERRATKYFPV